MVIIMEDIITETTFLSYLIPFLKLVIYLNDDTDKKQVCIETYNKFRKIELEMKALEKNPLADVDQTTSDSIRKCLKRINLSLKVDTNGKPVNISDRSNQIIIFSLEPFPAMKSGNLEEAYEYSMQHNINVLTDIPLRLILSKKNELVFLYLRCMFYHTQFLLAQREKNKFSHVMDDACEMLPIIMENIERVAEKDKKSGNILASIDSLLSGKLSDSKIDSQVLQDSKEEMMKLLNSGAGKSDNKTFNLMFDKLGSKISNLDFSGGNIIQSIMNLAKDIADDIQHDVEKDPESFKNDIGSLQTMVAGISESSMLPNELSSIVGNLSTVMANQDNDENKEAATQSLIGQLGDICKTNGLDADDILQNIKKE